MLNEIGKDLHDVSIPKRGSEAVKPPALIKYTIFGFQGAFARTTKIVADLG